jgi:hypothetical protein
MKGDISVRLEYVYYINKPQMTENILQTNQVHKSTYKSRSEKCSLTIRFHGLSGSAHRRSKRTPIGTNLRVQK